MTTNTLVDRITVWIARARAMQVALDLDGHDRGEVARQAGQLLDLAEDMERALAKTQPQPSTTIRGECALETCGHLRQLDAIVDLLGVPRGTCSVLDWLRTKKAGADRWSGLAGRQVWEALITAPKVAGPWVAGEGGEMDVRRAIDGAIVATTLWTTPKHPVATWRIPVGTHDRSGADAILREHGWLLVDER